MVDCIPMGTDFRASLGIFIIRSQKVQTILNKHILRKQLVKMLKDLSIKNKNYQ